MKRHLNLRVGLRMAGLVSLVIVSNAFLAPAQTDTTSGSQITTKSESLSPAELVRAAVKNEVAASKESSALHSFRSEKKTPRGSQTKLYVETKDCMAGIVIANNDEPLTPQQRQGELDHLDGLVNDPQQLRNKRAREKEDADRTLRMVKALPDAFLYEYDGTETGTATIGHSGDELMRLKFRPNPDYSPPSRVEQVLSGMKGYLLVDAKKMRLAKIDGTLFREVGFGWGILGHLDEGGHFLVDQAELDDGSWEITRMSLKFTGKALFFKSINIVSDEVLSDFRSVPSDTTFAQGVQMLKAGQAKLAENREDRAEKEAAAPRDDPHE